MSTTDDNNNPSVPPLPPDNARGGSSRDDDFFKVLSDDSLSDDAPVFQPKVDPEVIAEEAKEAEHHRHRRRMSPEHIRRIKRKRRIRRLLIAVGVLVLAIVALGAWLGISALKAKSEVEAAVSSASVIQQQVMDGKADEAKQSIDDFSNHVDATYQQTKQPVWRLAEFLPRVGGDVRAVRSAVNILEDVSNNALPQLSESVQGLDLNQIGIRDGRVELGSLASVADKLVAANKVIADANVNLQNVSGTTIDQLTNALTQAKEKFSQLADMTSLAAKVASLAPGMLDVDPNTANDGVPRTYLVLVQNNAELRATGGIPGSWGVLTVDNGTMIINAFEPASGEVVANQPILPLTSDEANLFSVKMGTFQQDVNFTPDFSRAAALAAAMWKQLKGQQVDGVVSVDPVFLQNLLQVTGPLAVNDSIQLTGDNAAQMLLNQPYITMGTQEAQDAFFSSAATFAFYHILTHASGNNTGLISAMQQSVADGHMYVWSAHEEEQKQLDGTAIAGNLRTNPSEPQAGVYFNDATMGKMDWYLKREVSCEYDKTYPSGAKQYTIHVKLTNTVDPAQAKNFMPLLLGFDHQGAVRHGEIETIMYLYAPAGGRLVDWSQEFNTISVHDGLTVGALTTTLQPGESFEFTAHVIVSSTADGNEMILRQTPVVNKE